MRTPKPTATVDDLMSATRELDGAASHIRQALIQGDFELAFRQLANLQRLSTWFLDELVKSSRIQRRRT